MGSRFRKDEKKVPIDHALGILKIKTQENRTFKKNTIYIRNKTTKGSEIAHKNNFKYKNSTV